MDIKKIFLKINKLLEKFDVFNLNTKSINPLFYIIFFIIYLNLAFFLDRIFCEKKISCEIGVGQTILLLFFILFFLILFLNRVFYQKKGLFIKENIELAFFTVVILIVVIWWLVK